MSLSITQQYFEKGDSTMENYTGHPSMENERNSARLCICISDLEEIHDLLIADRDSIMHAVKGKNVYYFVSQIQQNLEALRDVPALHDAVVKLSYLLKQLLNRDATRANVSQAIFDLVSEIDKLIKAERAKQVRTFFNELAKHADEISEIIDIDSIFG